MPFLGDVRFSIWTGHSKYSSMELALRLVFLFVAAILLIVFLWFLRINSMEEWAWEQRAVVVLLIGVLALNGGLSSLLNNNY